MSYLDLAKDLYRMIGEGNMMEAFEKYYHNDVVMIEATRDVRTGKAYNREFEQKFFASLDKMHDGGVTAFTSNEEEGVTMVETWMDASFKDGTRMKTEQVAVQKWQDGQIIRERFYFSMPG
nr:nuclear transport factor 2 family protein [Bacteroidota bacterium]